MLHFKGLAIHLQGEAINISCHIVNMIYLRPKANKTPYKIWKGKKSAVKYFRAFGSKFYIIRERKFGQV